MTHEIQRSLVGGTLTAPVATDQPQYEPVTEPMQPLPKDFVRQHYPAGVDFCVLRKALGCISERELFAVVGWMRAVILHKACKYYGTQAGKGREAVPRT